MIQGFIFDMDGTMIDNMMVHHRAWQQLLKSLGLHMSLEQVRQEIHGVNTEILERLFGDSLTMNERFDIASQKEKMYRETFGSQLMLLPGLASFLEDAQRLQIPMVIGTAAPAENVDFVLDNLDIRHFFSGIVHAGDVQKGKPDPETFIKAAEILDLPPHDCLVFEDSVSGAQTAANAGCTAIIVTTTHDKEEFSHFTHIPYFIGNFREISVSDVIRI